MARDLCHYSLLSIYNMQHVDIGQNQMVMGFCQRVAYYNVIAVIMVILLLYTTKSIQVSS